ncbi:MAG: pyridoxamine 5'-phosphate oxidase family protein [Acidobacteria bacterium]|nr:pyridoxamine 5'-phosphate oxidase family protein [Acidobacteriota bacterium]
MIVRDLSDVECRRMLARKSLARLACARDGQPYLVPILCYFDPEGGCLYSIAAEGQKIAWMRENPKVCVELSEITDRFNWTTVLVFGRFEELSDRPQHEAARHRARALFEQREDWWFPAMQKPEPDVPASAVIYRIRIDEMTGRKGQRS